MTAIAGLREAERFLQAVVDLSHEVFRQTTYGADDAGLGKCVDVLALNCRRMSETALPPLWCIEINEELRRLAACQAGVRREHCEDGIAQPRVVVVRLDNNCRPPLRRLPRALREIEDDNVASCNSHEEGWSAWS